MTRNLKDYQVLSFDCYGTLIDWESGIWDALQPLIVANARDDVERDTSLRAFGELESTQEAATPGMAYPEVLQQVHRAFAERFGLTTTDELNDAFATSVPHWPAFPDTADALRILREHYQLVILSNVNRDGFAASNRKLGVAFDAIYTAEDVGSYKPAAANFDYLASHLQSDLGVGIDFVLHTAQSLFHDHVPAHQAGLARAWIDRQGLAKGGSWGATTEVAEYPSADFTFPTLMAMAEAASRDSPAAGRRSIFESDS